MLLSLFVFKLQQQLEENKKLQEQTIELQERVMVQEKVEVESEQQTSLEAELSFEDVQGDRSEEDRLTQAEKDERLRKQLQVWTPRVELNTDSEKRERNTKYPTCPCISMSVVWKNVPC